MELLMILTYAAICAAVFKIFRIPVNKWTLPTAVLGGIFLIAVVLLVMNYNHPFSANARIFFATTPIMPSVKGRVIEVPVKANEPLKQGDVLFKIDPRPYQYQVDQRTALLAEAEQNVKQLKTAYDQALANVEKVKTQVKLAQDEYDRQDYLFKKDVIAQATLDTATRNVDAAKQGLAASEAAAEGARLAYKSEIGGVNTTVARLQADLADAQFDLDQTVVQAPSPGYVTQMALRPGMYVVPAPLRPVMTFVHKDDQELAAGFEQNALQRVRVGDEAEVAFDALPGTILKGKVEVRARFDRNGTAPSDWHAAGYRGGRTRGTGRRHHRHYGRHLQLQPSRRLVGSGGALHRICAPLCYHPPHPPADAELAELRVS